MGVSHEDRKLYVICGTSVKILELLGRHTKTTKIVSDYTIYIKTNRDRKFYADRKTYTVHCCHLNEEELRQLNMTAKNFPRGVTADNDNNVFVVSYISEKLTIIQHDGENSKILLTQLDGLSC